MKKCMFRALGPGLSAVVLLACATHANAQFNPFPNTPLDPGTWSDLDPFNRNSSVSKNIDSVMGGRFSVTIRNPTRHVVFYTLNGRDPGGLMPGYQRTHTGVGTAEIRFDIGRGDGSISAYTLGSGRTYHFQYRYLQGVGVTPGGSFLELYRD
jgi:hypothetical protein